MRVSISDLISESAESGVGLALEDETGRLLFFIAGTKFHCPPGALFYAGIGGHRLKDEDWQACAHREAIEELGTDVDVISSHTTWYITTGGAVSELDLWDEYKPIAIYEMVHPPGTQRAGGTYYIVIYRARLREVPPSLPLDEIRAIIALTRRQVVQGLEIKQSLAHLLSTGASIIAEAEHVKRKTRLYPVGTAAALATLLRNMAFRKAFSRALTRGAERKIG